MVQKRELEMPFTFTEMSGVKALHSSRLGVAGFKLRPQTAFLRATCGKIRQHLGSDPPRRGHVSAYSDTRLGDAKRRVL